MMPMIVYQSKQNTAFISRLKVKLPHSSYILFFWVGWATFSYSTCHQYDICYFVMTLGVITQQEIHVNTHIYYSCSSLTETYGGCRLMTTRLSIGYLLSLISLSVSLLYR